jgi:hypothetical protein
VVLVVYGGGDGLARFAYQVAKHYEKTTPFEVGLVEADDNDHQALNAEIHVFFDGLRFSVVVVRPAADGQKLGRDLLALMSEAVKTVRK